MKYRKDAEERGDAEDIFICETLRELNRALLSYSDLRQEYLI